MWGHTLGVLTCCPPWTSTLVSCSIYNGVTGSAIFTGLGLAFVNVRLAVGSCVPLEAATLVVPQQISTGAPIVAGHSSTVINVGLTSISLIS